LFGIIQHFTFNGKLYWLVPLPPGVGPFGPFVDPDHFAGFVELTAPLGFALLAFLSRRQRVGRRQLLGAATIVLVAGYFIVWLGVSKAIERFALLAHEGISRELRVSIYQDTWRMVLDRPWFGTGLGTLVAVYPRYASFYNGLTVDHAHND